jgi:serine/threonine protein kinase
MELMRNELFVLEKTDHPNVVRVFEILETKGKFFVVMEFLSEGDLMGKVVKMHNFSEDHAAMIVDQILHGLNYIHNQNLTHRDLKPDNIMCIGDGDNMKIKLTDFGFACFFNPNKKMDISLGTPYYMAPELVDGRKYDQRVDIWSLGCITYILLSGKLPFDGDNLEEIGEAIMKKDI